MRAILANTFENHSQELYRTVLPILKNVDNADDIMNDLFVKIQITASKSLPTKNCKAWLHTTVRNLARNKLKRDSYCTPIEWVDDIPDPSPVRKKCWIRLTSRWRSPAWRKQKKE